MSKIPIFKCRASCAGKIMTEPRGKSNMQKYQEAKEKYSLSKKRLSEFKNQECKSAVELRKKLAIMEAEIENLSSLKDKKELSDTCKQYLKEWIIEHKYGRKNEFSSKYTEKGKETEQAGFQLIQEVRFKGSKVFLSKHQGYYEDDYFTGNPDVLVPDFVIDNKSSWDLFTFPILKEEIPVDGYDYQGRVYMRLTSRNNFLLSYTLNDTPLEIVSDEISRYSRNKNLIDINDETAYYVAKNFIFTLEKLNEIKPYLFPNADTSNFIEIPKEKRYIDFLIEKDLEVESAMINRVLDCREWINENYDKI